MLTSTCRKASSSYLECIVTQFLHLLLAIVVDVDANVHQVNVHRSQLAVSPESSPILEQFLRFHCDL
ncbi:hypothetical protein CsSME_00014071 [Camellia sinensis var. sinensis]